LKKQHRDKSKIQKYIVIPDLHVPLHDDKSLNAVNQFMKDHAPWDGLIYLGDVLDMNCISSHNADKLRNVEGQRLLADYKLADKLI
jgi:hypothetical protein